MKKQYTCFSRYLSSKKTLDDRSLNRHVWDTLKANLPNRPIRILEIGAGIGTMIERVVEWRLVEQAEYHAIDSAETNIKVLNHRMSKLESELVISAEAITLADYIATHPEPFDLLIAHAFLDLLPLPDALPSLLSLVKPNGLLYFTINFDGITTFEPAIEPSFDAQIETLYHQNMDDRPTGGDSRSGRHLLNYLPKVGAEILAAGSSDWVVFPPYPADEAYFLHFIIDTMSGALADQSALDSARFARWIEQRHAQIEEGELVYLAHQLDILASLPDTHTNV